MKALVKLSWIILLVLVFASCSTKPVAITFGEDHCHFCKMTIVDEKFGAELVTVKGKVYKFDDVKCFFNFYNSGYESQEIFKHKLVVDFAGQGTLIDAHRALYLTSPEIRSPMDGQVAAFLSQTKMYDVNKQWNGTYLTWDELTSRFN